MKVALLVSGDYRTFDLAVKSWKFLKGAEVDLYVSTWHRCVSINKQLNFFSETEITVERILEAIKDTQFNFRKANIEDIRNLPDDKLRPNFMFYNWSRVIELMSSTKEMYDAIILIRPDLFLEEKIPGTVLNVISNIKSNILYSLSGGVNSQGADDQFFLVSQDDIKKFAGLTYVRGDPDIHKFMGDYIISSFESVRSLGFENRGIIRPNLSSENDLIIDKVNKFERQWWESYYGIPCESTPPTD